MITRLQWLVLGAVSILGSAAAQELPPRLPEAAIAGFEKRVDSLFRADSGKLLERAKKKKPLEAGRGNFVRAYSYSMVNFAARCLYLGEMPGEANAALAENAQHYLDNPKDINDRDSFHWHADIVMRLIEMFGSKGTKRVGIITAETEALCLKPIWLYAKSCSSLAKADHEKSQTWHIYGSENHHSMDFSVNWHFAKLAKDRPEYSDRKFDDGATAADHYRTWNEYFVRYCQERAKKGVCIEMMCPGYNTVWMKGFLNFHDFGDEPVRRAAGMLLDLYWAYWAQEQIGGVDGGGKARVRQMNGYTHSWNGIPGLGWMYFGIGEPPPTLHGEMNAALGSYRPPAVVADIALNARVGGVYEVRQRAQGLGSRGSTQASLHSHLQPNRLRTDGGGIIRYSYCDPSFTMGTLMTEARPVEDWTAISAQARWQGVIFAGDPESRIVPVVIPHRTKDVLNGFWSVQSKGSLITQKLKESKGGGDMVVWVSDQGLSKPVAADGVVLVEAKGAYAAIRVAGSNFRSAENRRPEEVPEGGSCFVPEDEFAPVIIEVMAKEKAGSFGDFRDRVLACKPVMNGSVLGYRSIYGDEMTFDTGYKQVPSVNGKAIDYAPLKVFESPFLNADYNSGVVNIFRGDRNKVLDFTTLTREPAR